MGASKEHWCQIKMQLIFESQLPLFLTKDPEERGNREAPSCVPFQSESPLQSHLNRTATTDTTTVTISRNPMLISLRVDMSPI